MHRVQESSVKQTYESDPRSSVREEDVWLREPFDLALCVSLDL